MPKPCMENTVLVALPRLLVLAFSLEMVAHSGYSPPMPTPRMNLHA